MSKWINLLLVLAFSLTYLPSQAQSVDEIVNKYIDAMGGKEKLNSIKSLYMEGVAVAQRRRWIAIFRRRRPLYFSRQCG